MLLAQKWGSVARSRKCFVVFKLDGGTIGGSSEDIVKRVDRGTTIGSIKPSNPTKVNNDFIGWDKLDDEIVMEDCVVTAQYQVYAITLQENRTYDTTGMVIGTYDIPSYGYIKTSACGTERGSNHGWKVTFIDANGDPIGKSTDLSHPTPSGWTPRYGQSIVEVPSNAVKAKFEIYTDDREYYWIEYIKWAVRASEGDSYEPGTVLLDVRNGRSGSFTMEKASVVKLEAWDTGEYGWGRCIVTRDGTQIANVYGDGSSHVTQIVNCAIGDVLSGSTDTEGGRARFVVI